MVIGFTGEGPTDYGFYEYNNKTNINEWVWGTAKVFCDVILKKNSLEQLNVQYQNVSKDMYKSKDGWWYLLYRCGSRG